MHSEIWNAASKGFATNGGNPCHSKAFGRVPKHRSGGAPRCAWLERLKLQAGMDEILKLLLARLLLAACSLQLVGLKQEQGKKEKKLFELQRESSLFVTGGIVEMAIQLER